MLEIAGAHIEGLNLIPGSREDFVMSAFKSFCRGIHENKVNFDNESGLWGFLCCLTLRKIFMERRRQSAIRAGGKKIIIHETDLAVSDAPDGASLFGCVDGGALPPPMLAEIEEESRRLLFLYSDNPKLQEIVELRLDGWTSSEIAEKMKIMPRTVNYHLSRIRYRWLCLRNNIDIIRMKFRGLSDAEVSEETELPADWIAVFCKTVLALWAGEPTSRYNTAPWINFLNHYFKTCKISDLRTFWPDNAVSSIKIRSSLDFIAERWEEKLQLDWRTHCEDFWSDFEAVEPETKQAEDN